jgi:hypothetical protein
MRFVADLLGDCKQPLRSSLDGNSGDGGGGSNSGGCRGASSGKGGNCSGMKDSESSGAGGGSNDGANCLKPGGRGWAACIKVRASQRDSFICCITWSPCWNQAKQ